MSRSATQQRAWASELRAINQAFQAREEELASYSSGLQQEIDTQRAVLDDTTQQSASVREALEQTVATLEGDLRVRKEQSRSLTERLEDATSAADQAQAEVGAVRQMLEADAERALREHEVRLRAEFEQRLAKRNTELEEQARDRERSVDVERRAAATAVQAAIAHALEQQQTTAQQSARQIEAARVELAASTTRLIEAERVCEALEQTVATLEGDLRVRKEQSRSLTVRLEDATSAADQAQAEVGSVRQMLEADAERALREHEVRLRAEFEQRLAKCSAQHAAELDERTRDRDELEQAHQQSVREHREALLLALESSRLEQEREYEVKLQERLAELRRGLMAALETANRDRESISLARLEQEMIARTAEQAAAREQEFAVNLERDQHRMNDRLSAEQSAWREREDALLRLANEARCSAEADRTTLTEEFAAQIAALECLYRERELTSVSIADAARLESFEQLEQAIANPHDQRQAIRSCDASHTDTRRSLWLRLFSPPRSVGEGHSAVTLRDVQPSLPLAVTKPPTSIGDQHGHVETSPDHAAKTESKSMPKTAASPSTMAELLEHFDSDFVVHAYRVILGRAPDPSGLHNYLSLVRAGKSKERVIAELATSPEGQSRGVSFDGIDELLRRNRPKRRSLLAKLLRQAPSTPIDRLSEQVRSAENWLGVLRAQQASIQMLLEQKSDRADQAHAAQLDRCDKIATSLAQANVRLAAQQAQVARLADSPVYLLEMHRHRTALEEQARALAARTDAVFESMRELSAGRQTPIQLPMVEVKRRADPLETIVARPVRTTQTLSNASGGSNAAADGAEPGLDIVTIMENVIREAHLAREHGS